MAYIIQPYSDDTGRNCPESYLAIGKVEIPTPDSFQRIITLNRYMSKEAADEGKQSFEQTNVEITVGTTEGDEYVSAVAAALPGATVVND